MHSIISGREIRAIKINEDRTQRKFLFIRIKSFFRVGYVLMGVRGAPARRNMANLSTVNDF